MVLACYLTVHQNEGIVFKDLDELNKTLVENSAIRELVEFDDPNPEDFEGWISQNEDGSILLNERDEAYFGGYNDRIQVWYCWDTDAAQIIADGMTAGKLVLYLEVEGNESSYYILTPGKVEVRYRSGIRF